MACPAPDPAAAEAPLEAEAASRIARALNQVRLDWAFAVGLAFPRALALGAGGLFAPGPLGAASRFSACSADALPLSRMPRRAEEAPLPLR